jgi:hypothetical protein
MNMPCRQCICLAACKGRYNSFGKHELFIRKKFMDNCSLLDRYFKENCYPNEAREAMNFHKFFKGKTK